MDAEFYYYERIYYGLCVLLLVKRPSRIIHAIPFNVGETYLTKRPEMFQKIGPCSAQSGLTDHLRIPSLRSGRVFINRQNWSLSQLVLKERQISLTDFFLFASSESMRRLQQLYGSVSLEDIYIYVPGTRCNPLCATKTESRIPLRGGIAFLFLSGRDAKILKQAPKDLIRSPRSLRTEERNRPTTDRPPGTYLSFWSSALRFLKDSTRTWSSSACCSCSEDSCCVKSATENANGWVCVPESSNRSAVVSSVFEFQFGIDFFSL